MKRITLLDIAKKTGFSSASVSGALNHNPKTNKETAAFIRKTALEMGYTPDPVFAEMGRNRWKREQTQAGENLILLTDVDLDDLRKEILVRLIDYARSKGYRLALRSMREFTSVQQADREFRARGVRGIMSFIWQQESAQFLANLNTEHIAVVSEESDLAIFHSLSRNWAGILTSLVLKMEEKGYRKISLLLFQNDPPRFYDRQRMGTLLALQDEISGTLRIHQLQPTWNETPALRRTEQDKIDEKKQVESLDELLATDQPDAIIAWSAGDFHFLKHLGIRMPEDLGFAALVSRGDCSGMNSSEEPLWRAQLDKLIAQIRHVDFGRPSHPIISLFTPDFLDAGTF